LNTKLPSPSWPSPIVYEEFVRSFGGVRRRRGGGISGWVAESEFCDARKAIGRIDGKALRYFSDCNVRFRTVFRRLYSDGLALAKVELGLSSGNGCVNSKTPEGMSAPVFGDVEGLLRDILSLSIWVREPNGRSEVELAGAGKSLGALYEFSTTRCNGNPRFEASGLVKPESPMLFIEAANHELEVADLPFHKERLTLGPQIASPTSEVTEQHVSGPDLFHWWTQFGNSEISVWLLRRASGFSSEPVYKFERNLRIYLLRLHAERVVLRRALKFVGGERECSSDALQHYFNVAIKRVGKYEWYTTELAGGADDVALFAQSFMDAISPGELDGLLQRISTIVPRTNVERQITEYAKSIVNVNHLSIQAPGGHIGDNYIRSGQPPNIGPNASVTDTSRTKQVAILFLAANANDNSRLRLDEELREIRDELERAKLRDRFALHSRGAVRPKDFVRAILDLSPMFVHFSGHGESGGSIHMENDSGDTLEVPPEAVANLFKVIGSNVQCVLLNACFSEIQAREIAANVPYVIGMSREIGDRAAIAFATGFYRAIGAGRTIPEAFQLGLLELKMYSIPEQSIPRLLRKP
jgi:hypothetical protein